MIRFVDRDTRLGRREFLRVGSAGLAAAALGGRRVFGDAVAPGLLTGRSVIFLFLHGGPSQFETFDPKMDRPEGIRSATGEVATNLPGVTFGSSFPRLAAMADRLTIVRSFVPGDADHNIKPLVGRDTFDANPGAILARVAGGNHPVTGLPTNVLLLPRAVDPMAQPGEMSFGRFGSVGPLSPADAPYDPSSGAATVELPRDRMDDRRRLLGRLDDLARSLEHASALDGVDGMRDQAFGLLQGGLADAFDLSKEDPKVVQRYDTAPLVNVDAIDKKWNNHKNYADNARTLGKLLLLARRLCERGAGFVTVTTNFVWDMHADVNNATMTEGMRYMGPPLDHAVSAFVEDLHARGLEDRILLVACGEMGRSPKINGAGGRDHWGRLGPLLLAGGGRTHGRVIGHSDRDGAAPQTEPITGKHLSATLLHTMFDVGLLRLVPNLPREFGQTMAGWEPIPAE